jgi:hypothetical protein
MVIKTTQVTINNVSIGLDGVLSVGEFGDIESDIQFPSDFEVPNIGDFTNSDKLSALNVLVGGYRGYGSFEITTSSDDKPFKIFIKNRTGSHLDNLVIKIAKR